MARGRPKKNLGINLENNPQIQISIESNNNIKKENKKIDIYICLDCGREYENNIPFPQGCICGNAAEEFFRLKDRYDIEDEKACRPFCGVRYSEEILKEKFPEYLKEIKEKRKTIKQNIEQSFEGLIINKEKKHNNIILEDNNFLEEEIIDVNKNVFIE